MMLPSLLEAAAPEFLLLGGILGCLVWSCLTPRATSSVYPLLRLTSFIVLGSFVLTMLTVRQGDLGSLGFFEMTFLSCALKMLLLGLTFLFLAFFEWELRQRGGVLPREVFFLLLSTLLGAMAGVSAHDFLLLFLALELQSLSLCLLIPMVQKTASACEASLRLFFMGWLSATFFLLGASLLYGFTGSTDFSVIKGFALSSASVPVAALVGSALILLSLFMKLALMPSAFWLVEVYEGTPPSLLPFFATVPQVALAGILLKLFLAPLLLKPEVWKTVALAFGLLSICWGSFAGLAQFHVKKLMAYSAAIHMGWVLLGLATGSVTGYQGALLTVFVYALEMLGILGCLTLIKGKDNPSPFHFNDLCALPERSPRLAFCLMIFLLSHMGIPPLAGFWGKFLVLTALVGKGLAIYASLALLMLVVASFNLLRLIKAMYFDESLQEHVVPIIAGTKVRFVVFSLIAFVLLFPSSVNGVARLLFFLLPRLKTILGL